MADRFAEIQAQVAAAQQRLSDLQSFTPAPIAFAGLGGGRVAVTPDASKPGRWRATRIDADGEPTGHIEAPDWAGALRAAKDSGADLFRVVWP